VSARPPAMTPDELAGGLGSGEVELGTYTDEELLAVTPHVPDDLRLVPLSTLADADEATRATALQTAVRSLVARGLVASVAGEDDDVEALEVSGGLALVLDGLTAPRAVTLADRDEGAQHAERVWYAMGTVAVLDHEPLPGGLHRFALRRADRAARALAAFLDPHGWAVRDGEALRHRVDRPPPVGWERVDRATEQARVSARVFTTGWSPDAAEEREALVAAGPDGVWLLSVDTADGAVVVTAVEVSPASLLATATAMLTGRAS